MSLLSILAVAICAKPELSLWGAKVRALLAGTVEPSQKDEACYGEEDAGGAAGKGKGWRVPGMGSEKMHILPPIILGTTIQPTGWIRKLSSTYAFYYYFSFLFFSFFFFLGLHPWHMEVPKLGVESVLQLPAYATATHNPSYVCNLHHSSWQCWILNPLSKARN